MTTDGHARLLEALRAGDGAEARDILAADSALCTTEDTPSALLLSLYQMQFEVAELIAARREWLSLFEAAAVGDVDALSHHLRREGAVGEVAPDGFSALHLACFFKQPGAVRQLLAAGADPNATTANASELRPLHSAVAARSVEIVSRLLEAGADPDVQQAGGYTPLHAAALHGDEAVVDLLLEAGADPGLADDNGTTASGHAAAEDHRMLAERLAGPAT
jgi:ankyrin repeat protein